MPELPEVEHLRRSLEPVLLGRTIVKATLHRRDIAVMPADPQGGFSRSSSDARPARLTRRDLLQDALIDRLERKGKQLAILATDGRSLCVHLGMTGGLFHLPASQIEKRDHVHATWRLDDGSRLVFRDPRRFGGLWICPSRECLYKRWGSLGSDALNIKSHALSAAFQRRKAPVKAALLNQRVLAGVGNIYADESLFRARIRPGRPSQSLGASEIRCLASSIRAILRQAIKAGGSSISDYRDAQDRQGLQQHRHAVYGRSGKPCVDCGTPLHTEVIAQRTTVWCFYCQK